jgi:hypothetical protein
LDQERAKIIVTPRRVGESIEIPRIINAQFAIRKESAYIVVFNSLDVLN